MYVDLECMYQIVVDDSAWVEVLVQCTWLKTKQEYRFKRTVQEWANTKFVRSCQNLAWENIKHFTEYA